MKLWILFAAAAALQILDIVTTVWAFASGAVEANKGMAWLMAKIGVGPALAISKLAVCGGLAAAIVYWPSVYLAWVMGLIIVFYVYFVIKNFRLCKSKPC